MKKMVSVFAVADEVIYLSNVDTLVTGIGKTNAAYEMTRFLMEQSPDMVINIGTAGSAKYQIGDIVVGRHFVDRDYDKLMAYGVRSEIEFDRADGLNLPSLLNGVEQYIDVIVNTGDDFVCTDTVFRGDVVDMEAFAVATVCKNLGVPMVSVKYVTDVIGQNSLKQWEEKLMDARIALKAYFDTYL